MEQATKEEIFQLMEELAYWDELAKLLSWRLVGWTGMETATYATSDEEGLTLTPRQRDDIMISIMERVPAKP